MASRLYNVLTSFKRNTVELQPVAMALSPAFAHTVCTACGCECNDPPKRCSACNFVRYCSRKCQTKDWWRHGNECSKLLTETSFKKWSLVDVEAAEKALLIARFYDPNDPENEQAAIASGKLDPKSHQTYLSLPFGEPLHVKLAVAYLRRHPIDQVIFDKAYEKALSARPLMSRIKGETRRVGSVLDCGETAIHSCRPNVQLARRRITTAIVPLPSSTWEPLVDAHDKDNVRMDLTWLSATKGVRRFDLKRKNIVNHCECARCVDPDDDQLAAIRCEMCGKSIPMDDTEFRHVTEARFHKVSDNTKNRLDQILPGLSRLLTPQHLDECEYYDAKWTKLLLVCNACKAVQSKEWIERALAVMSLIGIVSATDWQPIDNSKGAKFKFDAECKTVLPLTNWFASLWLEYSVTEASGLALARDERLSRLLHVWTTMKRSFPFGHAGRFETAIDVCELLIASSRFDDVAPIFAELQYATEIFAAVGTQEANPHAQALARFVLSTPSRSMCAESLAIASADILRRLMNVSEALQPLADRV